MKRLFGCYLVAFASLSGGLHAQSVTSVVTSGYIDTGFIGVGVPVQIQISFNHSFPGDGWGGYSNGFDLYSPDGATWTPSTQGYFGAGGQALISGFGPAGRFVLTFSRDGVGNDTVALAGMHQSPPFNDIDSLNDVVAQISIASFPLSDTGKTFCIDSCTNYPPTNDWSFGAFFSATIVYPDWGTGTHASLYVPGQGYCYTLRKPIYVCGNINNNPMNMITVADVTYLVNFLFNNGPAIPAPIFRANMNCVGGVGPTVADNTYLVRYLFDNGPAPCANCP